MSRERQSSNSPQWPAPSTPGSRLSPGQQITPLPPFSTLLPNELRHPSSPSPRLPGIESITAALPVESVSADPGSRNIGVQQTRRDAIEAGLESVTSALSTAPLATGREIIPRVWDADAGPSSTPSASEVQLVPVARDPQAQEADISPGLRATGDPDIDSITSGLQAAIVSPDPESVETEGKRTGVDSDEECLLGKRTELPEEELREIAKRRKLKRKPKTPKAEVPEEKQGVEETLFRSRETSQRFRMRQAERERSLEGHVERLRVENYKLAGQLEEERKSAYVHAMGGVELCEDAAKILGVDKISGMVAAVMLHVVAMHRGLFGSGNKEGEYSDYWVRQTLQPALVSLPLRDFEVLQTIYSGWMKNERERLVEEMSTDDDEESEGSQESTVISPGVKTRNVGRKREEGANRCKRCRQLKCAGSNHPRSFCSDGRSVSSPVPFVDPALSLSEKSEPELTGEQS